MRKILLGVVIAGFALVIFISVRPFTSGLTLTPEPPQTNVPEEEVVLEPAGFFTVRQGESYLALLVTNNMSETVTFSLGHEHDHLTFNPRDDRLAPGRTREIDLLVGHQCPPGEIELPAYLRAEVNGERFGLETVIVLEVIPGELSMESNNGEIEVLWNGEPAPGGVLVTYRLPGEEDWRVWGETPRLAPPDHLEAGNHDFEFMARLGEVESPIEVFKIEVEEKVVEEEEEEEPPKEQKPASAPSAEPDEIEHGTIPWDGGTYTGPIKNGQPHGRGLWTHPEGKEYQGGFVEGSIEGRGVMVFPGGVEYRGDFKDGKAHGEGTMKHPHHGSKSGIWKDGKYMGEKEVDDSGDWYKN